MSTVSDLEPKPSTTSLTAQEALYITNAALVKIAIEEVNQAKILIKEFAKKGFLSVSFEEELLGEIAIDMLRRDGFVVLFTNEGSFDQKWRYKVWWKNGNVLRNL